MHLSPYPNRLTPSPQHQLSLQSISHCYRRGRHSLHMARTYTACSYDTPAKPCAASRSTLRVANPTRTFRLPSGATTAVTRRERLRRARTAPDRCTDSVSTAFLILGHNIEMACRRRLSRARVMHNEHRSRSSSTLCRSIVPEQPTSGTPSSSNPGVPLDEIRNSLRMTKISDASDSDSLASESSTETVKPSKQHSSSRSRPSSRSRRRSDPGLGAFEIVEVVRHRQR